MKTALYFALVTAATLDDAREELHDAGLEILENHGSVDYLEEEGLNTYLFRVRGSSDIDLNTGETLRAYLTNDGGWLDNLLGAGNDAHVITF